MLQNAGREPPVPAGGSSGNGGGVPGQSPADAGAPAPEAGLRLGLPCPVDLREMSIFRLRDLCVTLELDPGGGKEECAQRLENSDLFGGEFGRYGVGFSRTLSMIRAQHGATQATRRRTHLPSPLAGDDSDGDDIDNMDYSQLVRLEQTLGSVPKGVTPQQLEEVSLTQSIDAQGVATLQDTPCPVCLELFEEGNRV
eukprot:Rhum_TRINITY_DN11930_c0_g2::Rhum_TRINITY_DN11930_c0_g2_i1::g.48217::m.48217